MQATRSGFGYTGVMMPAPAPAPATPGTRFRQALANACIPIPGVFNALTARMAQRAGP